MAKSGEIPVVTESDVTRAEADLKAACDEADRLRVAFVHDVEEVTQDNIRSQQGVVEWLELVLERTKNQAERWAEEETRQGRVALREDVLASDAKDAAAAVDALERFYEAAVEFVDLANSRNAVLSSFLSRARSLGISEKDRASLKPEGLALDGVNNLILDGFTHKAVSAHDYLGLVVGEVQNGVLPKARDDFDAVKRALSLQIAGK